MPDADSVSSSAGGGAESADAGLSLGLRQDARVTDTSIVNPAWTPPSLADSR